MATGGSDQEFKKLEDDFNDGDPLDLTQYKDILKLAGDFGFTTTQALEAVIVCGISDASNESIGQMTEYLFLDESDRKKQYNKKKGESKNSVKIPASKLKIIDQIRRIQQQLDVELDKQKNLELELEERKVVKKVDKYCEFLRGIIADEIISDRETLALGAYRKFQNIDSKMHSSAMEQLDLNDGDLEDFKKDPNASDGRKCVVCHNGAKEYVVYNCMHVCMCESCARASDASKANAGPGGGGCPVCGAEVTKIERVYAD